MSPVVRESRSGVPRAERTRRTRGNLVTSWRRFVFAFAATFLCAAVVFTLPRFMNRAIGAAIHTFAQDTAKAQVVAPAPAVTPEPRSLGSRLTGIFGLILILGIGVALSRNRNGVRRRVGGWGGGLRLLFAIVVLRGVW